MTDGIDRHLSAAAARRLARAEGSGAARMREDWRILSDAEHAELDQIFATFFRGDDPLAERVIEYLRSITQHRVLGPDSNDFQLRHLEGARWLFGIINRRIERGRNPTKGSTK